MKKQKRELMDDWAPNMFLLFVAFGCWFVGNWSSSYFVSTLTGFSLIALSYSFFWAKRRIK